VRLTGEDHAPVSSTRIRSLVAAGDVVGAAALLGRPHEVGAPWSTATAGAHPSCGFPTANLEVSSTSHLRPTGIYAGHYRRPDGTG